MSLIPITESNDTPSFKRGLVPSILKWPGRGQNLRGRVLLARFKRDWYDGILLFASVTQRGWHDGYGV